MIYITKMLSQSIEYVIMCPTYLSKQASKKKIQILHNLCALKYLKHQNQTNPNFKGLFVVQ